MTRGLVFCGVVATLGGCVAPEVCSDEWESEDFSTPSTSGEQTLGDAGEVGNVRFRATLRGLSELWPAEHPVRTAYLAVIVHLAYADQSQTGGVATQMPRFEVKLASEAAIEWSDAHETPAFPAASGLNYATQLFAECYDGYEEDENDLACCEYGSTECSLDVVLRYERREGEPFPPVRLSWEARVQASVDTCPLAEAVELTLEVEQP